MSVPFNDRWQRPDSQTTSLSITVPGPGDPKFAQAEQAGPLFVQQAEAMVISNDDQLLEAEQLLRRFARAKQQVEDLFVRPLSDAQEAKRAAERTRKSIVESQDTLLRPLLRADGMVRAKVSAYRVQLDRETARKKLENEAAARRRVEDEQLERAARLENLAQATGDDAYRLAAERELNSAARPLVVEPVAPAPKTTGVSYPDVIGVEVRDVRALCRAVADGAV